MNTYYPSSPTSTSKWAMLLGSVVCMCAACSNCVPQEDHLDLSSEVGPAPLKQLWPHTFASGFEAPTAVTPHAGGLLVAEQAGLLSIISTSTTPPLVTKLSDFRSWIGGVRPGAYGGLLNILPIPGAQDSYVLYAVRMNGSRIDVARFRIGDDSPQTIIAIEVPYDDSMHLGGGLAFDADGSLYIGVGDASRHDDDYHTAQDTTALFGKILRVGLPQGNQEGYIVPDDNPFASSEDVRPEIYAIGFRNPWRLTNAVGVGLLAGDVGERTNEEIDLVSAGMNYGWPHREGKVCRSQDGTPQECSIDSRYQDPLWSYGRDQGGTVVLGPVIAEFPPMSVHEPSIVVGDWVKGNVWLLPLRGLVSKPVAILVSQSPGVASLAVTDDRLFGTVSTVGEIVEFLPHQPVLLDSTKSCRETLVQQGSAWRWHYSEERPVGWPAMDDRSTTGWRIGNGPLGYDADTSMGTVIPWGSDTKRKYPTAYFATQMEVANDDAMSFTARVRADDGYVLYINGHEVRRENLPVHTSVGHESYALRALSGPEEMVPKDSFQIPDGVVLRGANWIAVEVHQSDGGSSDLIFDMEVCGG